MGSFAEERRLMTTESAVSNQGPHQKPHSSEWSLGSLELPAHKTGELSHTDPWYPRHTKQSGNREKCPKWNLSLSPQTSLLMQNLNFANSWNQGEKSRMWHCISGDSHKLSAKVCSHSHDGKKISGRWQVWYTSVSFPLRKHGQMTTFFLLSFQKVYAVGKEKNIWN